MEYNAILRIIDGTRKNDADMVIRYAKKLVPEEEYDILEKCVKEHSNPNAAVAVMDDTNDVEMLKDQLDTLYMTYLSQVSLYKFNYEIEKEKVRKLNNAIESFVRENKSIPPEFSNFLMVGTKVLSNVSMIGLHLKVIFT